MDTAGDDVDEDTEGRIISYANSTTHTTLEMLSRAGKTKSTTKRIFCVKYRLKIKYITVSIKFHGFDPGTGLIFVTLVPNVNTVDIDKGSRFEIV